MGNYRFYVPVLPLVAVAVSAGYGTLLRRCPWPGRVLLAALSVVVGVRYARSQLRIAIERPYFYEAWMPPSWYFDQQKPSTIRFWELSEASWHPAYGLELEPIVLFVIDRTRPGDWVYTPGIGGPGYATDVNVIDSAGLVTPVAVAVNNGPATASATDAFLRYVRERAPVVVHLFDPPQVADLLLSGSAWFREGYVQDPVWPSLYVRRGAKPLDHEELVRNYRVAVSRMPNVARLRERASDVEQAGPQ
jgi:hypothetical protein